MSVSESSVIRNVPTGVPGLDAVLGGGLCESSFNLIAGAPGPGKTTLVQQILFANASRNGPRSTSRCSASRRSRCSATSRSSTSSIRREYRRRCASSISPRRRRAESSTACSSGSSRSRSVQPRIVVVDSFRTIVGEHSRLGSGGAIELARFVNRLAQHLTTWEVTSFLIGEYADNELRHPVFTVADAILWLSEDVDRNSATRKLRVVKVRGEARCPGCTRFG